MRVSWMAFALSMIVSLPAVQSSPRIIGIACAEYYVSDLATAKAFYGDFLGYNVTSDSSDSEFVQISPRQSLHLILNRSVGDRLAYLVFSTDDLWGLHKILALRGVAVSAGSKKGPEGESFRIMDPDGHVIQFVPYFELLDDKPADPLPGISSRMTHAGILVSSADASIKFYRDQLGFAETWRGSRDNKILSWVNLKVPDGNDYVEFMLYSKLAEPTKRGTQHHICLEVPDVKKAWDVLQTRTLPKECKAPTEMKTGVNGKRQINLFDPDGTRIEIMEPATFDGRPVPPSTAPAPQGEPLITELLHAKAAEGVPHYVTRATSP